MSKGISIITNFGCNNNCWYCIMKEHRMKDTKQHIDYHKLESFLIDNKHLGKVSISGGGDPLYNYFGNLKFWIWLINTCKDLNIKIDIHTREKLNKLSFWRKHVNLVAFSSDNIYDDIEYLRYLSKLTKVRMVHVATKHSSNTLIEKYIELSKELNCQLTIKQLHGHNDYGAYKRIKSLYSSKLFCLDDDDYNIYYMPDNSIVKKFML